ncbi:metallophosphoesterase family protein [Vibrio diazotrophicus]|uniref:metallophosphoesterase family protein n=1 Tax=Vibrio diazotrophicus TaxID=685 RepID=UPI0005A6AE26|nr:metallophosphoesterase family protein [Vibrio diazotrophicus]
MIAIISDIHGNLPALKAVLESIKKYDVEKIISLGDVSGYYPFVDDCIMILKENNVINLMGNHDFYLVSGLGCPRSKSVNELSSLFVNKISQEALIYLSNSPLFYKQNNIIMTHAGFNNPIDEYLYKLSQSYFEKFDYKFFFSGHTHVQHVEYFDNGQIYCNPGSVGQPRDGKPTASYALFCQNTNQIELNRVSYDPSSIINRLSAFGFGEYYHNNLLEGARIGGKIDRIEKQ